MFSDWSSNALWNRVHADVSWFSNQGTRRLGDHAAIRISYPLPSNPSTASILKICYQLSVIIAHTKSRIFCSGLLKDKSVAAEPPPALRCIPKVSKLPVVEASPCLPSRATSALVWGIGWATRDGCDVTWLAEHEKNKPWCEWQTSYAGGLYIIL